ncbi:hypothetical protein HGM15179_008637 [Zosterops borbonicus]|uniref:Uncharacterized protein n=1 Tax=Zosterops borbonicus TaxID=364589 RepID=A0A8K1GI34_9PASS|nr:hypothetical protein HGM15179_008637 [Zosterops borbonicus]
MVANKLLMSQQCVLVAKNAKGILGCIEQSFASRSTVLLVHPGEEHPECCAQFWVSQDNRDLEHLERVQWRATKMIEGLEYLSDKKSLRELGLFSLQKRWLRGALSICQYLKGWCQEDGPDSSCQAIGQETKEVPVQRYTGSST